MTNEKMLEIVSHALTLMGEQRGGELATLMINAKTILTEDVRKDCQKTRGLASRDKIISKVLGSIPAAKTEMVGWHEVGGKKAFCDGFRVFATIEDFGHPKAPEQLTKVLEAQLKTKSTTAVHINAADVRSYIKLEKIRVKELKAQNVKDHVVRDLRKLHIQPMRLTVQPRPDYTFEIGVNPEYLLELLSFFQTDTVYCSSPLEPIQYCDPETGDWAIILPCRLRD